jgi:hypothetical protein
MTDRDSLIPDVPPPEPMLAIHPLDLIELHARRLLTEWELAKEDERYLFTLSGGLVAKDVDTGESWSAKDHVELADVMGLGNLA